MLAREQSAASQCERGGGGGGGEACVEVSVQVEVNKTCSGVSKEGKRLVGGGTGCRRCEVPASVVEIKPGFCVMHSYVQILVAVAIDVLMAWSGEGQEHNMLPWLPRPYCTTQP